MSLCIGLFHCLKKSVVALLATLALATTAFASANLLAEHDHMELDASLVAPYNGEGNNDARTFTLRFAYPANAMQQTAHWRVQLRDPAGALVQEWAGKSVLADGVRDVNIAWAGRVGDAEKLPNGIYRVSLSAFAVDANISRRVPENILLDQATPLDDFDVIEQAWDIRVGNPPVPAMPAFNALPTAASNTAARQSSKGRTEAAVARAAPATGSLPYTVYFGNLHSQTNHSDGGGTIGSCTSSQPAQTGAFGPADTALSRSPVLQRHWCRRSRRNNGCVPMSSEYQDPHFWHTGMRQPGQMHRSARAATRCMNRSRHRRRNGWSGCADCRNRRCMEANLSPVRRGRPRPRCGLCCPGVRRCCWRR